MNQARAKLLLKQAVIRAQRRTVRREQWRVEDLKCAICLLLPIDPCRIIPCGHSFCNICLSTWLKTLNHSCPVCRGMPKKFIKDKILRAKTEIVVRKLNARGKSDLGYKRRFSWYDSQCSVIKQNMPIKSFNRIAAKNFVKILQKFPAFVRDAVQRAQRNVLEMSRTPEELVLHVNNFTTTMNSLTDEMMDLTNQINRIIETLVNDSSYETSDEDE